MMMNREAREELYDPKKQHKGSWLDFVKAHKNMRTAKGLLDLKAISKLWKGKGSKTVTHKKPAKKGSWRLFVKARMSSYMKKYGSHGAAIRQIAKEWKDYKKNILKKLNLRKTDKYSKYAAQARQHYAGQGKLINASPAERAAAFAQMRQDGTLRGYDTNPHGLSRPPKNWFYAMLKGIESQSDVKNPSAIVGNIWKKLTPQKRSIISAHAAKGKSFKYDLPLPDDRETKGTGTLRMVKPFKLAEVQVNLSIKDYLAALKSGLFSKMKRNDGTVALVARCKSEHKNCNIFVDKVT